MLVRPWQAEVGQAKLPDRGAERDFISLADITSFIRRYIRSIVACVIAGLALAWCMLAMTEPIYTARVQILIEPKLPQYLQEQGSGVSTSLDTAQIESQMTVMRSEKIATMVIEDLQLEDNPDFFQLRGPSMAQRLRSLVTAVLKTAGLDESGLVQDDAERDASQLEAATDADTPQLTEFERDRIAIALFQRNLGVSRLGVSYVVEITFSSKSAELAANVANAAAETFVEEQIETKAEAARQGGRWLETRLDEMREKMNTATQIAQDFRARHDYRVLPPGAELVDGQVVYTDEDGAAAKEGPTLEELEVTAEAYRKMYESFLLAFTSNLSQQSYPVADARVITAATRPLGPSRPRRKLTMAFGFVAGGFFGVGLAFLRHALDGTLRSPAQIREQFGQECIGELPRVRRRRRGFALLDEVLASPKSRFAESLRRARAAMGLADTVQPLRTIGITSALRGEGKSMCASNLALLYSASGQRVLLVDTDTDHATLSTRLGAAPDTLRPMEPLQLPVSIAGEIRRGAHHSVDLLASATVDAKALLSPSRLQALLPDLGAYDVLILDLPPLTAGADKLAIGGLLDGVIVVAEWGRTPVDLVGELLWTLQANKSPIIGVLMTNVRQMSTKPHRRRWFQDSR
jgi:uncharacterized protein involved in exopolysaccharide biosynthesis/Mrp family chromosome partitioning ATPase